MSHETWAAVPPAFAPGWPPLEACRETGEIRYADTGEIAPASRPGPGKNPVVRRKKARALDVRTLVAAAFTTGAATSALTVRLKYGCGPGAPPSLENLAIRCHDCADDDPGETFVDLDATHPLLQRLGIDAKLRVGDRGTVRDAAGEVMRRKPFRPASRDPVVSVPTRGGATAAVRVHWLVMATVCPEASAFARIRADVPVDANGMYSCRLEDLRLRHVAICGDRRCIVP